MYKCRFKVFSKLTFPLAMYLPHFLPISGFCSGLGKGKGQKDEEMRE